jgi:hypothetical protein
MLAGLTAMAQDAAPPSLLEQLEAEYNLAKVTYNSGQATVTEQGTVLVIQKDGIQGAPPGSVITPTTVCKNGALQPSKASQMVRKIPWHKFQGFVPQVGGSDSRALPAGEKVYATNIDVDLKNERIGFRIIECDACNGVNQPSSYKAAVSFQFAKGYLESASVPDVEDAIGRVFAIDTGATEAQPQAAEPAQPQSQPTQIQLGQTIDQVVAMLGQPEKMVTLGSKQIYVYKDLKVTFVNGTVSDAQ